MPTFVNPYNFVPLVERVYRDKPNGHDRARPGLLSGWIDYRLTCTTPARVGDDAVLQASHVRGALRTLHEALTGSCLRVFADKFVPVYREPVANRGRKLGFYVTPSSPNDCGAILPAIEDQIAETGVVKIDSRCLNPANDVRTLARLDFDVSQLTHGPMPHDAVPRLRVGSHITLGIGDWRLLVSDTRAKYRRPRNGQVQPTYWFAARRSQSEPLKLKSPGVLAEFYEAVRGADDLRPGANQIAAPVTSTGHDFIPDGRELVPVTIPPPDQPGGSIVGYRLKVEKNLFTGYPLWYETDAEGLVTWIGISQVWRHKGAFATGKRLPANSDSTRETRVLPCHDPDDLCPSCMTFGSADVRGREVDARAEQHSYRGHVRALQPNPVCEFGPEEVTLSVAGSPRPGAGQFYLVGEDIWDKDQLDNPGPLVPPKRRWGSSLDKETPRQLRGRKFYWTTSQIRDTGPGVQESAFQLIPQGTEFDGQLVFENLAPAQLGALLAALDPRLWLSTWQKPGASGLNSESARFRLGGFKPQGLGAAKVDIVAVRPTSTARWLGSNEPDELDATALVEEWVKFNVDSRPEVIQTWDSLAHLVTEDFVAADQIRYPGAPGDTEGFWKSSEGFITDRGGLNENFSPLRVLPDATDPADKQRRNVGPQREDWR